MKLIILIIGLLFLLSNISKSTSTISSSSSSSSSSNNGNLGPIQNYDFEFISKHLSTKTPYYILSKDDDDDGSGNSSSQSSSSGSSSSSSSSSTIPEPPQCKLISINLLARHGSRMPVLSSIERLKMMTTDLSDFKNQVVDEFQWIFNYSVPYPTDIAGNLILQGQYEHYNISRRLLNKYPEFFKTMKYKPQSYQITSTAISRTGISASSFSFGLLQGTGKLGGSDIGFQPFFVQTASLNEDNLLRFYSTCQAYTSEIKNGSIINKDEQSKWDTMIFPNISAQISQRLGLSEYWQPTNDIVSNMIETCAYEISINNITDHWCSLFDKQNILDWEYSQDLSNYWLKSYGHKINYEIASILLQDIINDFDKYLSSSSSSSSSSSNDDELLSPTAVLRFGHAETVIPFITLLGLYKDDEKLYSNSTKEQIENRKFRTSVVSPYASNIAMFLFDCGGGSASSGSNDGFKILIEHNELPVLIPGCDEIYCDYNQFKSIFSNVIKFDWKSYCHIQKHNNSSGGNGSSADNNDSSTSPSSSTSSPSSVGKFLSIFIPISFIIGLTFGALFTYFGYDRIRMFRRSSHQQIFDNEDNYNQSKSTKFTSSSPLIQ